jgi:branched-chain amino acid transport system ATP-binding protein
MMVEHRLKELFRIAHRVMALNFGSKIADGSAREVMENDAVKSAYLGSEEEEGEDA